MSPTQPDSHGHALLEARLRAIPDHLAAMSRNFAGRLRAHPTPRRVVATGIGSSEAQARYLVWLLNRFTDIPAEFTPLSRFAAPVGPEMAGRTLVVFSQGISSNARLALDHQGAFEHLVLFTASTEAGLRIAGKAGRADLLARLVARGAEIVRFPIEDEYTILIRVVGPATGFLAARLWAGALPGARCPNADLATRALSAWQRGASAEAATELSTRLTNDFKALAGGFVLLVPPAMADCAQNLACKFVEGLFLPAPAIIDLLQFAHGPFQQLAAQPRPVLILHRDTPGESDLAGRARTMCSELPLPWVTSAALGSDEDLLVLEAESLLSQPVAAAIRAHGIDQVRWPGKGLDGPLYNFPA
jgi:hypothetical protein